MKKFLLLTLAVVMCCMSGFAQNIIINNTLSCPLVVRTFADQPNSPAPGAVCPRTGGTSAEIGIPPATVTVVPVTSLNWISCANAGWDPSWIMGNVLVHDQCASGIAMVSGPVMGQVTGNWCTCFSGGYTSSCPGACSVSNMVWTDLRNGDIRIDIY